MSDLVHRERKLFWLRTFSIFARIGGSLVLWL